MSDTTYNNKMYLLFGSPFHKNFTVIMLDLDIYFGMGDIWESFLKNMRVRTKYAEKTCIDLWDRSTILKGVWDVTQDLKKRLFNLRFLFYH